MLDSIADNAVCLFGARPEYSLYSSVPGEIIGMPHKITVPALRNNAGAVGEIMLLACDKIFAREGLVLNPHYLTMGLYGSEYWTHLLPKRLGDKNFISEIR